MREQLIHRPLVAILLGLVCGLSWTFGYWPLLAVPGLLLAVREVRFSIFVLVAFGIGFLMRPPEPAGFFEAYDFGGTAQIISVPDHFASGSSAQIEIQGTRYRMAYKEVPGVTRGDMVRVRGVLGPLSEASGYGAGAKGVLRAETVEKVREGPIWWHWGESVASSFRESVVSELSEPSAALVRGVCFNQTDGLMLEDWESFRRFGIVHILSASGFHVVVVAGMLLGLFSLFPIPRMWQLGFVLVVLSLFAIAAGLKPPILRAVLMTAVVLPAYAFRREGDGISAVAFAGAMNLLLNPVVLVDLGFHLSMMTTLGLVMAISRRRWESWNWLQRLIYPSLIASAASFPIVGMVFGEVSLIGLIGNTLVTPLVAILVVVSLVAWLSSVLVPPVGHLLWMPIDLLARLIRGIVDIGAGLPGSLVVIPAYSMIGVVCLYGILLVAWRRYALD
ncbi:MAG: ComEC/Rec2 family competence protein [Fimbriimonadaceae bacterium]